jgi:hypothetical protein
MAGVTGSQAGRQGPIGGRLAHGPGTERAGDPWGPALGRDPHPGTDAVLEQPLERAQAQQAPAAAPAAVLDAVVGDTSHRSAASRAGCLATRHRLGTSAP